MLSWLSNPVQGCLGMVLPEVGCILPAPPSEGQPLTNMVIRLKLLHALHVTLGCVRFIAEANQDKTNEHDLINLQNEKVYERKTDQVCLL